MTARFLNDRRALAAALCGLLVWAGRAPVLAEPAAAAAGTRFYVSSSAGDDAADGTSPQRPWRSLERVSQQAFAPGDQILFKAGDRFAGQLALRSSGSAGRPLVVAAYGKGPRPVIDGAADPEGAYQAAILIRNQHDIEITGLEVVNDIRKLRRGEDGGTAYGILFIDDAGGVLERFRLHDLVIHDVFAKALAHGSEEAFNRITVSAVRFVVSAVRPGAAPSYFRDIRIEDNDISRSGRFGVQIAHGGTAGAPPAAQDGRGRDPETGFNRDIVIARNRFHELGGSGVQLSGARMALLDGNTFLATGSSAVPGRMVGRGSGAWVVNSRDIAAQHNRSLHVRGYKDSYGMHVDFGNLNVLYQYNYSEDSEGGFVEILGNNRNVIWRYNISVNDGLREKEGNTLWVSPWSPRMTPSDGIYICNNAVFVRSGLYPDLSFTARGVHIWNNIFMAAREAMIGEKLTLELGGTPLDLKGNLFFGRVNPQFVALDKGGRKGDPLFIEPGSIEPAGYRLRRGSPAIGSAAAADLPVFPEAGHGVFAGISSQAVADFFGNPLGDGGAGNIGAYGGPGGDLAASSGGARGR